MKHQGNGIHVMTSLAMVYSTFTMHIIYLVNMFLCYHGRFTIVALIDYQQYMIHIHVFNKRD
jgi:hypothetical protein